ncbi:MAG: hypothetical protein U1F37_20060 [Alphaproteobacteria bacterium]
MPHDGIPRNGRMYSAGFPGWVAALALALVFCTAAVAAAFATGFFLLLVPALAIVALGYGLYLAASRRRARLVDRRRLGAIEDERAIRLRSRLRRR